MHNQIARQEVGEDQPCADSRLLNPLKRSAEYRIIHPRLLDIHPLDHWQQDGLHYFVFALRLPDGTVTAADAAPVVVFTMHPESTAPVSVVVVTPSADGGEAEVVNLRRPENSYAMPLLPTPLESPAAVNEPVVGSAIAVPETPPAESAEASIEPVAPAEAAESDVAGSPGDASPEPPARRPGDEWPAADPTLLGSLERSREYEALRSRLELAEPIDSWQHEDLHCFVFLLRTDSGVSVPPEEAPVAVFTMRPDAPEPVSAVVITPSPDGEQAAVLSLRQPESGYAVPLALWDEAAAAIAG